MILIDSARFDQLVTTSPVSAPWSAPGSHLVRQQPTWKMSQHVIDEKPTLISNHV